VFGIAFLAVGGALVAARMWLRRRTGRPFSVGNGAWSALFVAGAVIGVIEHHFWLALLSLGGAVVCAEWAKRDWQRGR
jgi:hypothetical protein